MLVIGSNVEFKGVKVGISVAGPPVKLKPIVAFELTQENCNVDVVGAVSVPANVINGTVLPAQKDKFGKDVEIIGSK